MLHATRRLLTDDLHPLERGAATELVSLRGGAEDAEALLPLLLADPVAHADLVDPVAPPGDRALTQPLLGRIVADGPTRELLEDEQLLAANDLELPEGLSLRSLPAWPRSPPARSSRSPRRTP